MPKGMNHCTEASQGHLGLRPSLFLRNPYRRQQCPSPRTTPSSSPRPPDLPRQLQPVGRATTASALHAKHSASHYLIQQGFLSPFERGGNGDARILSYLLSYMAKSRSESSAASLQTSDLNQDALLFCPPPPRRVRRGAPSLGISREMAHECSLSCGRF